jgi:hypothetical protein
MRQGQYLYRMSKPSEFAWTDGCSQCWCHRSSSFLAGFGCYTYSTVNHLLVSVTRAKESADITHILLGHWAQDTMFTTQQFCNGLWESSIRPLFVAHNPGVYCSASVIEWMHLIERVPRMTNNYDADLMGMVRRNATDGRTRTEQRQVTFTARCGEFERLFELFSIESGTMASLIREKTTWSIPEKLARTHALGQGDCTKNVHFLI